MHDFKKQWYEIGLDDADFEKIKAEIRNYPQSGVVVYGKCQFRKASFIYKNKDKVGSAKVIYAYFPEYKRIYLLSVYSENAVI